MLLSQYERDRFAQWCEDEAASNLAIGGQLADLDSGMMSEPIVKKLKVEGMACQIVANILRSITTETIG